ncbi:MAG: glutathione S-transferase family protein [Rhodospirillales bacterium]|jgi:glutathione S-transferase|nr:glutathione S-transferase family protein [Rhodospirillales bacterium]
MARQLYELAGADPAHRFSPFCWRSRMALAHKGLDAECVPWRFTETDRLAFANHNKVPVLVDGDTVVPDSWAIAEYLDRAYPDRPALFGTAKAAIRFITAWTDQVLHAALVRLIVSDIPPVLDPVAASYFRSTREAVFGKSLEAVTEGREGRLPEFRKLLDPLRKTLRSEPFLGGAAPDYADYAVFGAFQWARTVSPLALLAADDPVRDWRERLLDRFDGLARQTPAMAA